MTGTGLLKDGGRRRPVRAPTQKSGSWHFQGHRQLVESYWATQRVVGGHVGTWGIWRDIGGVMFGG